MGRKREPLTRERVLRAAFQLADEKGMEGLSMRHLAKKLNIQAMSLYYHFPNKDAILDGILELFYQEVCWPSKHTPQDNWQEAMRERAARICIVLKKHPWALQLLESRKNLGLANLRHHEEVMGCLRKAGFSVEMTAHAYALMDAFVYGFALQEQKLLFDGGASVQEVAENVSQNFLEGEYPYLREMVAEYYVKPEYSFSAELYFGLDLILDGLEKRRLLSGQH